MLGKKSAIVNIFNTERILSRYIRNTTYIGFRLAGFGELLIRVYYAP